MEFLIVNILEKAGVEHILHSVANDGAFVHTLDEGFGSHALAEAGDGGLVLVVLELLVGGLNVVFFLDINLDTEFQIT